jgi:ParB-like chromosome segregation protein Spo0J
MPRRLVRAPLARIRTVPGWDADLDPALVEELARTDLGVLDPLIVDHGWLLRDGRHRLAGLRRRGAKEHWVLVLAKTDDAARVTRETRLLRVHSAPAELAKLRAETIPQAGSAAAAAAKLGVSRSSVDKARRAVESFSPAETRALDGAKVSAAARLRAARSVEKMTPAARARALQDLVEAPPPKRGRPKGAGATKPRAAPPVADGLGRPLPEELRPVFAAAEARFRAPARAVRQAVAALSSDGTRLGRDLDVLRRRALALADELEGLAPFATCPHCKLVPTKRSGCAHCEKRGWVGKTVWLRAPVELQAGGEQAKIYVPGPKGTPVLALVSGLPGGGR